MEPWRAVSAGMTTRRWRDVPVVEVPLDWITTTQEHLQPGDVAAARLDPWRSWSGDPFPHLVWHGPALYLEDGHHRYAARREAGYTTMLARLLIGSLAEPPRMP